MKTEESNQSPIQNSSNNIHILNNSYAEFETNGPIETLFDFILVPFLNHLPKKIRGLLKRTHGSAKGVIENVTNHVALEILYNKGYVYKSKTLLNRLFRWIWFNTDNSKAVRNRLKIVEKEIGNFFDQIVKIKKEVNILSIASGSSKAFVNSILLKENKNNDINISFLDKNPEATEYSKKLMESINTSPNYHLSWINDTANNFPKYFSKKQDIIEMVGLLDYFDDDQFIKTISTIYNNLEKGGLSIIANINHNKERPFVEKVLGWKMIYRTPNDMIKLVEKAGVPNNEVNAYVEPLKIHTVLLINKQ